MFSVFVYTPPPSAHSGCGRVAPLAASVRSSDQMGILDTSTGRCLTLSASGEQERAPRAPCDQPAPSWSGVRGGGGRPAVQNTVRALRATGILFLAACAAPHRPFLALTALARRVAATKENVELFLALTLELILTQIWSRHGCSRDGATWPTWRSELTI